MSQIFALAPSALAYILFTFCWEVRTKTERSWERDSGRFWKNTCFVHFCENCARKFTLELNVQCKYGRTIFEQIRILNRTDSSVERVPHTDTLSRLERICICKKIWVGHWLECEYISVYSIYVYMSAYARQESMYMSRRICGEKQLSLE